MADISKEIERIRHAVYGEDVRQSIVDGLNKVNNTTDNEIKVISKKVNASIATVKNIGYPPIVLEGTKDAPLAQLKMYGRSVQDGTPSVSDPVEIENVGSNGSIGIKVVGKNLLDVSNLNDSGSAATSNGVTATVENGVISFSGTATDKATFNMPYFYIAPGSYHFSCNELPSSYNFKIEFVMQDNTNPMSPSGYSVYGTSMDFTLDVVSKIRFSFKINNNTDMAGIEFRLMLEAGTSRTEFEPYKEISANIPMTNSYGLPGVPVSSSDDWSYRVIENSEYWISDEIDFARGVYIKRCGVIDSYDGESITSTYISSTGGLDEEATVVYILDEEVETSLSSSQLNVLNTLRSFSDYTVIASTDENTPYLDVEAIANQKVYVDGEKLIVDI